MFLGEFHLTVEAGEFTDSEIIVMLGENGTGKTTMIKMLAGRLETDDSSGLSFVEPTFLLRKRIKFLLYYVIVKVPELNVSYKPQKISPKSTCSVRQMMHDKIRDAYVHPQFVADVMKPLMIDNIIDQEVKFLRLRFVEFSCY